MAVGKNKKLGKKAKVAGKKKAYVPALSLRSAMWGLQGWRTAADDADRSMRSRDAVSNAADDAAVLGSGRLSHTSVRHHRIACQR
jgi:ribosome modulation factor